MTALAEVGWNPGDDWTDFNARVTAHFTRWDEMKIKFRLPDLANIKEQVVFIETGKLDLTIPKGIDEVRYTMDESEPTEQSTLYDKPMSIDSSTNVKILTLGNGKRHGNRYTVKFEKQGYAPATVVADVKPGLTCKYFEGEYNSVNKINERDLKHTAIVDSIAIAPFCRASVFALEFTGFIDIPQEGIYTFYLSSDDGSTLTIGEREVVSNDGFHGDIEKSGQIALSKGLHPFVLKYFDGGGGNTVSLNFDGPSLARQKIPAAFFKTK
jgi:hexosaminidase